MEEVSVLVVTRGHRYERNAFFAMWEELAGIRWSHVEQPAAQQFFRPELADIHDVFVFYDMPGTKFWPRKGGGEHVGDLAQDYPPPAEFVERFEALLQAGKGLVFLHHAMFAWPTWPRYRDVTGGALLTTWGDVGGKHVPPSGFSRPPVVHRVVPTSPHPVTAGLEKGFDLEDEVYFKASGWEDEVVPLLRTTWELRHDNGFTCRAIDADEWHSIEHPPASDVVAWAKKAGNSPVVTIEGGDGPPAYANPNFRKLLVNAIRWVASPEAHAWARTASGP